MLGELFGPKQAEVAKAIAENKRVADYRWGTLWIISPEKATYGSFAWKPFLFVIGAFWVIGLLASLAK
ncbi:MAG TPA: hypothetical protein VNK04_17050 [Gemmataceae bacterium]|nr:hypothetical protein [Gemmataceae bacterium]